MSVAKSFRVPVNIVGPGRLGTALAKNLHRAGWPIQQIVVRPGKRISAATNRLARQLGAGVGKLGSELSLSGLVWITVPDDAIAQVAARLAPTQDWRGRVVFHSSGALTSRKLAPLASRGASVASVHPGMTFVHGIEQSLRGVPFGIEGDAKALRLARGVIASLGGRAVTISAERKALYHAFDAFASPLLIALMTALEEVGGAAGIHASKVRAMAAPLLQQTLKNYVEHSAAEAFSGPFVRGDAAVIERHLRALESLPNARAVYVALARTAVARLPVKSRGAMERLLGRELEQR
jgi:predicted short-subunit dehydrogenase-like oxidoreductase (DUF2520 family)